jgi:sigma-B regulation protein RsbU (phosphoserine phosphatase)
MATSPASLTVPGVLDAVPRVRRWLGDLLAGWRLAEPDAGDLALAVTEICTNIARHGYRDVAGDIEVRVARDAGAVHVTIVDRAPPFVPDPGSLPSPEALAEGGYGLGLVRSVVDEVHVQPMAGGGNRTVLVKRERVSERRELESLRQKLERQRQLVEASYALHSTLDLDELLGRILNAAVEGVQADRGTVFLLSDDRTEIWSRVMRGEQELEIRLPLAHGIAGTVAATGQTIRIDDAYGDRRFDPTWDERSGYRTREILCTPIRNRRGEIAGVFQLLNKPDGGFTAEDEEYLSALSVHAALAVENARLHRSALEKERQDREIGLARIVQRQLQPEWREERVGPITATGMNELCEDASGDYYDVLVPLPGSHFGVAIGDASGHGLQAALVMAETRALLRALMLTHAGDLPAAMDLLNDLLVPDMADGRFISLFVAVVHSRTGHVEWCNAGHNPPLLLRRGEDRPRELASTGYVMGVLPRAGYGRGEPFTLAPGDVLLLYTDGVTEARGRDRALFGTERLGLALAGARDRPPGEILHSVREAVRRFTGQAATPGPRREGGNRPGGNDDDLTMVVLKHESPA